MDLRQLVFLLVFVLFVVDVNVNVFVETIRTANVDADLAEVQMASVWRRLHDEVSARRHVAVTLEIDGSTVADLTGILATHVVIPQGGRRHVRRHVRQSNDKVVSQFGYNNTSLSYT